MSDDSTKKSESPEDRDAQTPRRRPRRGQGRRAKTVGAPGPLLALLRRLRGGDRRAEGELFLDVRRLLRRSAQVQLRGGAVLSHGASDLAQTSCAKIFLNLDKFTGTTEQELRGYVFRVLRNEIHDRRREARTQQRDVADPVVQHELRQRLAAQQLQLSEALRQKERQQHLWAQLTRLCPTQRQVLAQRLQGRTVDEIVGALGLDEENQCYRLLWRATTRLSGLLVGRDEEPQEPGSAALQVFCRYLYLVERGLIDRGSTAARHAFLAEHSAVAAEVGRILRTLDEILAQLEQAVAAEDEGRAHQGSSLSE